MSLIMTNILFQFLAVASKCPSLRFIIQMPIMFGEEESMASTQQGACKEKKKEKEKEGDGAHAVEVLDYEDALRRGKEHVVEPAVETVADPNKVVSIMYTSGSTGVPKVSSCLSLSLALALSLSLYRSLLRTLLSFSCTGYCGNRAYVA
mgnify:CR=1 FL=1